jgi:hypothetical protein
MKKIYLSVVMMLVTFVTAVVLEVLEMDTLFWNMCVGTLFCASVTAAFAGGTQVKFKTR